jgi:hypothetical protein
VVLCSLASAQAAPQLSPGVPRRKVGIRQCGRVYLVSALLACVVAARVAAGTAFVTVRLLAPAPTQSANTVILEGIAEVRFGEELEVFYKTPFAEPPHLTSRKDWAIAMW